MKFLHLADLHIGKTVNGYSMIPEQRHAFAQVMGYIEAEKPGAVLIAGDVYDRAVPGVEAVKVFDDLLTALVDLGAPVLIISGNHDSPERLSYASRLLAGRGLHLCGAFGGELRAVTLEDEHGPVSFWMLPFIKPSAVRALLNDKRIESYADAVAVVLEGAPVDYSRRNVLLSHQFYTAAGSQPIRSESEISPVGGLDAVDAALLARFDYAALGHLHGAQGLRQHIRYAGSPVKYSFSEWRQRKSATLVTLREKGDISVAELELKPLRDMREIKGPLEQLMRGGCEDYVRVILTDEDEVIDPLGKLRSAYPNIMALDFENSRTGIDLSAVMPDAGQIEALSPYDLFCEFFLSVSGGVMSEAQAEIVRELLEGGEDA